MSGVANPFSAALSDKSENMILKFKEGDFGGGSLYTSDAYAEQNDLSQCEVNTITIDSLNLKTDLPTFIKIDAEGAEYGIWKGGKEFFRNISMCCIMMEFTPAFITKHVDIRGFLKLISEYGFSFYLLENGKLNEKTEEEIFNKGNCYVFLLKNM